MTQDALRIRPFQPGDEEAFRTLNEAWIAGLFHIEPKDREVLGNPLRYIIEPGGEVFMALDAGRAVGCCAMIAMPDHCFELAKMAVAEDQRGRGVGRQILNYSIDAMWCRGARRIYLETSSKLPNAIHLYQSIGFRPVPAEKLVPSPYQRADVFLELFPGS